MRLRNHPISWKKEV
ncbi:hypothetical protein V3C99_010736, partial [Haemonchus contortus]